MEESDKCPTTCSCKPRLIYTYPRMQPTFFYLSSYNPIPECSFLLLLLLLLPLLRNFLVGVWIQSSPMAQTVGRNIAAPLLSLNLIMYIIVVGFASWSMNRFINGQTQNPGFGGNGATMFFLIFSLLAGVLGVASKLPGVYHVRAWRSDSLAGAGSSSIVAWALTALAFGLACKEINVGGHRGWRLRVLEAFIIILTFTQLLYLLLIHAGMFSSRYGPGYRETDYGMGTAAPGMDPVHKGAGAQTRV